MRKTIYIILILILMAISSGITKNNGHTDTNSLVTSISKGQYSNYHGQADSQSDNITRTIFISGYDKTGKMIEDGSNVIKLTPEQLAEADRLIEEYKKRYAQDPNLIRFPGCTITLTAGTVEVSILENGKMSGNDYYIIQFYTDQADLDKETRDTINQISSILYPIGNHAFYAKIPPEALDIVISLVNNGKIRYLGRIPIETKYYPELLTKAQQNPNSPINLAIKLFDDASDPDLAILSKLMRIDWHWTDAVAGEAPAGNIKDIIALNFVQWVEEDKPMALLNNDDASATTVPQDLQDYLVILNAGAENNKNSVLAINSVEYIQDAIYTGTDNDEYPAMVISANEQAVGQIRNLESVIALAPIANISDSSAGPDAPDAETTKAIHAHQIILAGIIGLSILALGMTVYLLIRRRRHASLN